MHACSTAFRAVHNYNYHVDFLFYIRRVIQLISSANVAIPTSFIVEGSTGKLELVVYIQVGDGYLSKEHLESAIAVS